MRKKISVNTTRVLKPSSITEMKNSLTAAQINALDILLAEINLDDDDSNLEYYIQASDFSEALGSKGENKYVFRHIRSAFTSLENIIIELAAENGEVGRRFVLIQETRWNKNTGEVYCVLSKAFKEFLVLQKKSGNLTFYELSLMLSLNGVYAKKLMPLVYRYKDTEVRYDKIDDLKEKLDVPQTYSQSKFESRIMKPAVAEINEKCGINLSYEYSGESISGGTKVNKVTFHIRPQKKSNPELPENDTISELKKIISEVDIWKLLNECNHDISVLKNALNAFNSSGSNIQNVTGWLISAIRENYKTIKKEKTAGGKIIEHGYSEKDIKDFESILLHQG